MVRAPSARGRWNSSISTVLDSIDGYKFANTGLLQDQRVSVYRHHGTVSVIEHGVGVTASLTCSVWLSAEAM